MNEYRTDPNSDTPLTQAGSRAVRYRLTDQDGKKYAAFRLKPGVSLLKIVTSAGPGSFDVDMIR